MDLVKVLSKLKIDPGYVENAKRVRAILDESEDRDSKFLRNIADLEMAKKKD